MDSLGFSYIYSLVKSFDLADDSRRKERAPPSHMSTPPICVFLFALLHTSFLLIETRGEKEQTGIQFPRSKERNAVYLSNSALFYRKIINRILNILPLFDCSMSNLHASGIFFPLILC